MMASGGKAAEFWAEFCAASGIDPREPYQVWYFGNTPEMARELAELVLTGTKTASASLAAVNEVKPDEAPILGGYSVVTDMGSEPICVIRTTEIRHMAFADVDTSFAFDEGEGDRTLEYWRAVHNSYFARESADLGIAFDDGSIVCCERFELLYPR